MGRTRGESYWACFEKLRKELGYADYLGWKGRSGFANRPYPLHEVRVASRTIRVS